MAENANSPNRMTKRVFAFLMAAILAGAFAVRVGRLSNVPSGLYIDEASFGYNAYSLLKTGRDEYGVRWPVYARSFYSGKNPVYLYSTVLSVRAFGLNTFATRFPAVVFGTLAVLFTALFVFALFGSCAAIVAALVCAFAPWGFMFSRTAFEPISLLCFVSLAAWLAALAVRLPRAAPWVGLASGLALYTYAPAFPFLPPLLVLFVFLFRKDISANRGRWVFAAVVFALLLLPHALPGIKGGSQAEHLRENLITSPLGRNLNAAIIDSMRLPGAESIKRNPAAAAVVIFAHNYLSGFGPVFLFQRGDISTTRQSVHGFGVLFWSLLPLMLIGIAESARKRKREHLLLFGWMFLYPIGPALATQWVPSAIREISALPLAAALAGIGALALLNVICGKANHAAMRAMAAIIVLGVVCGAGVESGRFYRHYFREYPVYGARAWYQGIEEAVRIADGMKDDYDIVSLSSEIPFAYIYPLFVLKVDPVIEQSNRGKEPGSEFKGRFGPFRVGEPRPCRAGKRCLYVGWAPRPEFMKTLRIVRHPDGSPAVYISEGISDGR